MIQFALAAMLAAAEEPPPPPEVVAAASAWNECLQEGVDASDRQASPRAVARRIEAGCRGDAQAMLAAHRRWVEGADLSDREKRDAIRSMERSVAGMTRMIELMVRASRDD